MCDGFLCSMSVTFDGAVVVVVELTQAPEDKPQKH